jgi:hypothetical protein
MKIFAIIVLYSGFSMYVQEEKPTELTKDQSAMMALVKATQNPVVAMNSVPLQFNWYSGGDLGAETLSITYLQPVLPMAISDYWNVVYRTIVPIISIPVQDGKRFKGIAHIQEQIFFCLSNPNKIIWGVGPINT